MMPGFEIGGGLPLVLARVLFVAMLLAAFGTLLFMVVVVPRALARADASIRAGIERRLLGLACVELSAGLLALPIWLLVQAGDMAGAASLREMVPAIGPVLAATEFGHLVLAQEGALLLTMLALRLPAGSPVSRLRVALALLTTALLLQGGHGHGWAMTRGPSLLLLASMLHLVAAGGWLGGLPPLLLLVRAAPPRLGAAAARWFSPLGKACVAGVAVSSVIQFWQLIGGLPGLVGTAYGWVACAKILLLGALLGFALLNRRRLAPALLGGLPDQARRRLVGSLALQTLVGLLTVLAAGMLGSLPPAMHVQPVWPFVLHATGA